MEAHPTIPQVAVGALVVKKDHHGDYQFLLVRRGKAPAQGLWALPGGKIEWGETMSEAVKREVMEETGLTIKVGKRIHVFDNITRDRQGSVEYHYVIIDFMAAPQDPEAPLLPGDDALEARWLNLADLENLPVSKPTYHLVRRILRKKDFTEV